MVEFEEIKRQNKINWEFSTVKAQILKTVQFISFYVNFLTNQTETKQKLNSDTRIKSQKQRKTHNWESILKLIHLFNYLRRQISSSINKRAGDTLCKHRPWLHHPQVPPHEPSLRRRWGSGNKRRKDGRKWGRRHLIVFPDGFPPKIRELVVIFLRLVFKRASVYSGNRVSEKVGEFLIVWL